MEKAVDQEYLRNQQYKNAANLTARMKLHERFSTSPFKWFDWVFDHIQVPGNAKILELGSGPGRLWLSTLERIPASWQITLSDFSTGMLAEAQQNLAHAPRPFAFRLIDAQEIPFPESSFDAVIANHMLYHVPDLTKALAEIQRVLKPGGFFLAATNSIHHMEEIDQLGQRFSPQYAGQRKHITPLGFNLENGAGLLQPWFSSLRMDPFPDMLKVTEAEPLVQYILSMMSGLAVADIALDVPQLQAFIEAEIRQKGFVAITKAVGLFICTK